MTHSHSVDAAPPVSPPPGDVLGVLLAGGEGRRFGGGKPLASLAGRPMAAWGADALRPHVAQLALVTNDPAVGPALGIPSRADRIPGRGPLGGLLTALEWAGEEGLSGVFLLACDLPLVGPDLVGRILSLWPAVARAVVPSSSGPRGFEPLCAGYRGTCLPAVLELLREGKGAMQELVERVDAARIPQADLGGAAILERAFTNVNTRRTAGSVERFLLEGSP